MIAHVLLPLAVNSKSERNVDSLPPLAFERATFDMLVHLYESSMCIYMTCVHFVAVSLAVFWVDTEKPNQPTTQSTGLGGRF
jgi:hypothetical protein